jgi:hypothetical protein
METDFKVDMQRQHPLWNRPGAQRFFSALAAASLRLRRQDTLSPFNRSQGAMSRNGVESRIT